MLIVHATVNISVDPTNTASRIVNGSSLALATLEHPNALFGCLLFNNGTDIWERGLYTNILLKIPTGEQVDGLWFDSQFLLYRNDDTVGRGNITDILYRADGITEFRGHLPMVI